MHLPPHLLARAVNEALLEDLGPGDATSEAVIPAEMQGRAEIRTRAPVVVAGIDAAIAAFRHLDAAAHVLRAARDGEAAGAGAVLLDVTARARALLSGERTALNFLARLSGTATLARRFAEAAAPHHAAISDTRKTTPCLRALERYAVAVGGATNHRFGLFDGILIKDNHVDLAGGVAEAVRRARRSNPHGLRVEVEVRTLAEVDEALEAGADEVLLDNFTPADLETAVARARGRALVEVSGGVRLEDVARIAALGVDRISVGALTHSAPSADLTMRITTWTT